MGFLDGWIDNAKNAASQVVHGASQMVQGGGVNQWGQNLRDGYTNYWSGLANGATAAPAALSPNGGNYFYTGGNGKFGTQIDLAGNPVDMSMGGGGDPYSGQPGIPAFHPVYDPSTMSMLPGYMQEQAANSTGLNAMRSIATSPGESPWARVAQEANDAQRVAAQDRGAQAVAGQAAGANAAMAMQGGLSEGARERNAEGAAKGFMNMSQDANRTASLNNLDIMKNDAANKMSMLSGVTGAEQNQVEGYGKARGMDITNQIGENQALNNYNMEKYGIQSGAWGAGKTADATAASAKHGPFG